jgi:hypothetical protein
LLVVCFLQAILLHAIKAEGKEEAYQQVEA